MPYESDDDDAWVVNADADTNAPENTATVAVVNDAGAGEDKPVAVDTANFSSLLARGLQHDEGAAAMREHQARRVGDGESQHRLQSLLDCVVRAFRECGQANRDEERLQAAVDSVDYAHELCPSWLRMPEETLYGKLAAHARNLARRLDERSEMAKNIPQSLVRDIDAITVAVSANIPDAMRDFDGLNAITSLRALTQTLDRARGTAASAGGSDSTLEDKAFKCRRLVEAFIKLQENDTKVMMHSKHIVGPMSDLRRHVANELTTMSHDNTTSDAQYLWSAIQGFANILAEYCSIDSLFRRCIPTALQKESRTVYDNRMSHFPSGPDTMLRRVQFMPFVVIEAYAARDENTIRLVRNTLEREMSSVMSDNTHLLKLVGATLIKAGEEAYAIDPLKRATAEQVSALVRLNLPFHRDISQREAHAMLQGAAMVNRVATQQPVARGKVSIEARLEREPRQFATTASAAPPAPAAPASKAGPLMDSIKCKMCGGTIRWVAGNEANKANAQKMHLQSTVHMKALEEKKKQSKSKAKVKVEKKEPVRQLEDGEFVMSEVPPPPMSSSMGTKSNGSVHLQSVPPPPTVYGESSSSVATSRFPTVDLKIPGMTSPQFAPRLGKHTTASTPSPSAQSDVLARLERPAAANVTPPRAKKATSRSTSMREKIKSSQAVCVFFQSGKCKSGPKCQFRHDVSASLVAAKANHPCTFFQSGECRNGPLCPFRHDSSARRMSDVRSAPPPPVSTNKRPRPPDAHGSSQGTARTSPRPVKKSSAICVDFNTGYCSAGLQCPFRHEMSDCHSE